MQSKQPTVSNLLFGLGFGGLGGFVFLKRRHDLEQTGFTVPTAMHTQVGQVKEERMRTWHGPLG